MKKGEIVNWIDISTLKLIEFLIKIKYSIIYTKFNYSNLQKIEIFCKIFIFIVLKLAIAALTKKVGKYN